MDGYAFGHGLPDLKEAPLDRLVNFIWWLWTRSGSEEDKTKFKARLWLPPKGVAVTDSRSPWSPEAESSAFGALKASLGL